MKRIDRRVEVYASRRTQRLRKDDNYLCFRFITTAVIPGINPRIIEYIGR